MQDDEADFGIEALMEATQRLSTGFQARLARWSAAGAEWDRFASAVQEGYGGVALLLAAMALGGGASAAAYALTQRLLLRWTKASGWAAALASHAASFLMAILVAVVVARLVSRGHPQAQMSIAGAGVAAALGGAIWSLHGALIRAARERRGRLLSPAAERLIRGLNLAFGWGLFGAATLRMLTVWQAGPGLRDLAGTFCFGLPVVAAIAAVTLAYRRQVAALVGGPRPRSRSRAQMARQWPGLLTGAIVAIFLSGQLALTLGNPLPALALISASVALLSLPHLDNALWRWGTAARHSDHLPAMRVALRRTARPAALAALAAIVLSVWLSPLIALTGRGTGQLAWLALEIALIGLVSALGWNVATVLTDRAMGGAAAAGHSDEEANAPRTRFETLAPLLAATAKTVIAALGLLSVLAALGVSVWPIVTGLGVFGIAIGFGSQTLVKDVVSGLFFLADDAFRMGEYIETTGAKGTVEKISLRSVSLRHHRGPLATIPYGSIGRVLNFSRDYAIEKLAFRVAIDTDVDKVRRIFKTIGQELAEDPELKDDLLQPFKSQGIDNVEDGTLIVRGKFMAKAGRQHSIRKKVMMAVHKAFLENGIQAVARPLSASGAR